MIRVCPLKDRACPNGIACTEPCARDRYYDPNSKPSQDARGTARHNNKSPCTDGEVEKLKEELAKSREYATSLLNSGLDLKARAERAEAEREQDKLVLNSVINRITIKLIAAEAERDALKYPPDEVLERMVIAFAKDAGFIMGDEIAPHWIRAMRAALAAADGEQASIPTTQQVD